jgi:UrcA family protein
MKNSDKRAGASGGYDSMRRGFLATADRNAFFKAVAIALIGAIPTVVRAGPWGQREPETATAVVSMSDLDLSTATGIREARQRIESTANRLCHGLINDNMVAAQVWYEECAREAAADAVRRLHAAIWVATN